MPDTATLTHSDPTLARPRGEQSLWTRYGSWVAFFFLGLLWFILCRHLSGEWSVNEQYSYGWFVPFFAAYLFWLRFEDRPLGAGGLDGSAALGSGAEAGTLEHQDRPKPELQILNSKLEDQREPLTSDRRSLTFPFLLSTFAVLLLAALLPLRLFEIGNPDWRPLGWLHALIVVAVTLIAIWYAGGTRWVRHFAFPVCFILIAVPWVSAIEVPIVQGLMRIVAAIAAETLALFGIPAQLEGSVIRISTGVVGVNEACSGVRSLQTSLMIGLLFGELKRLSVPRRVTLVLVASGIAFVANCARAFFLVWIAATRNPEAVNEWHDLAGYAIVGAVFAGTMAAAALLGRAEQKSDVSSQQSGSSEDGPLLSDHRPLTSDLRRLTSSHRFSTALSIAALAWLLAVEAGAEMWYRAHEGDLVAAQQWSIRYPEQAPGFREIELDEQVRSTLRYDTGRQVAWQPQFAADEASQASANESAITNNRRNAATAILMFFRWETGTSTILRARSHRPDVCLPNVGWKQSGDSGVRDYGVGGSATLPFRHFAFVREVPGQRTGYAHSFFCMREDKVRGDKGAAFDLTADQRTSNWMADDRIRVVREGIRNPGQQVMQFVLITPMEIDAEQAAARFRELLPQLVTVDAPDNEKVGKLK